MINLLNLTNETAKDKVEKVHELIKNSGDDFVFITLETKVGKVTDYVTRIYARDVLKYHASNHIAFLRPDGSHFISDKGTSMFNATKKDEDENADVVGTFESFLFWVYNSTYIHAFTGKRFRDLLKGCQKVDEAIGHTSFEWFFSKYKNEFLWAMSDGRKANLLKERNYEEDNIPAFFMTEKDK